MRILIVGASSFLGGHLRRAAADAGHTVVTAGRSALPGTHLRLDLVADTPERVARLLAAAAPQALVNCAGATAGSADALAAANITAVHTLVTAALRYRSPLRFVHVGSAAEYGLTPPGVPVAETACPRPAGLYGATKLGGTRLVELGRTAGLDAAVLRVFNVVGAGMPEDSMPGQAAAQLRRGPSRRLGPLDAVRDFVDARDVADAVLAAAAAPDLPHPVVNIGSGSGVQARTLVRQLLAVAGRDVAVTEDAPGSARSAAVPWQQADISLAARDLGWRPRRALAESLRDLWGEGS
jgi:nucleoside-diphosphate-sugar epimerase